MEAEEDSAIAEPVRVEAQTIGRYRLLYELGAGGMATVFLARAEGPGGFAKPVAIKRIHPHLARRKDLVEMFLDEARLASLISHPNVCNTFDFGEDQGTYYLAMEYLVGEPLNVVERRVARSPELLANARWQRTLAKIVADACEGLHAAHEQKDERGRPLAVVHRDVSPHNVFVTYDGAVKVLDFGVAFAADRITKTVTGSIKGKLGYLAPEQLAHAPYDRRLDVWALGIVLWEGLTGQRLFLGRTEVDTILAVENKVIPPPSSVIASVPPDLDAIALRCLSRAPEGRFPTARAVARELHQFLARSGPPLTAVEVGEVVSEVCHDRREVRTEIAAAIVAEDTALVGDETSQTRTVRGASDATVLGDGPPTDRPPPPLSLAAERDTDIRAPAPFLPPRVTPALPPLAMRAPERTPSVVRDAIHHERTAKITARMATAMIVAVSAVAAVSVTALLVVAFATRPEANDAGGARADVPLTIVPAAPPPLPPTTAAPVAAPTVEPVAVPVVPSTSAPMVERVEADRVSDRASGDRAGLATGRVAVVCAVSVEVCIRERCAQTPTVFPEVPVGRTVLRLRARDGRRWSETVTVHRGRLERVVTSPP